MAITLQSNSISTFTTVTSVDEVTSGSTNFSVSSYDTLIISVVADTANSNVIVTGIESGNTSILVTDLDDFTTANVDVEVFQGVFVDQPSVTVEAGFEIDVIVVDGDTFTATGYDVGFANVSIVGNTLAIMGETTGNTTITVTNTNNDSYATVDVEVTPGVPTLTSITPNTGEIGQAIPVTISGTFLSNWTSVDFADSHITASDVSIVNDNTLTATVDIGMVAVLGNTTVTVTTPSGNSNPKTFTVTNIPLSGAITKHLSGPFRIIGPPKSPTRVILGQSVVEGGLNNALMTINGNAIINGSLVVTDIGDSAIAASTIVVSDDVATDVTAYPLWVTGTSGSQATFISTSEISFNPSTGELSTQVSLPGLVGNIISTSSASLSISELDESFSSEAQTGFVQWGGSGNYWSSSGFQFNLLRPGTGFVRGRKVSWGPQSIILSPNTTSLVGINIDGIISISNEDELDTFVSHIPLFLVLYDGAQQTVSKETHGYGTPPSVVFWNHQIKGSVLTSSGGAVITRVTTGTGSVATDRELMIVGDDILYDLTLTTTVPDSGGAAVSWDIYYTDGSGYWIRDSQATEFPMSYNSSGTVTALGAGQFSVFNLYVAKENLNTATPIYIAVMDNTSYASSAAAGTAISNGAIAFATAELDELQLGHLGYIIVENTTGGYIQTVTVAKSIESEIVGGANATAGALITLNASSFTNFLSPSDINVQAALNDINTNITGTGNIVLDDSPTLITPDLGTPSALIGTNITGTAANLTVGTASVASNVTGVVAILNGGTGQTTAVDAFNTLSPIAAEGDLIIGTGVNTSANLSIGANTYVLTSDGTTAFWQAPVIGPGTVSSINADGGITGLTFSGGPITTTGNLSLGGTLAITSGGTGNSSGTAVSAGNVAIIDDTVTNANLYPVWASGTSGNQPLRVSSTNLTFNPSNGNLTATNFTGDLTGNADSATNIDVTDDTTTDALMYPVWVSANVGVNSSNVSSTKLGFNPSEGTLLVNTSTDDGVNKLQVNGTISVATHTPSSASDTGVAGTVTWDANYIYVCVATDTWTRAPIVSW